MLRAVPRYAIPVLLVGIFMGFAPGLAEAASAQLQFHRGSGADACLDEADLRQGIADVLGAEAFDEDSPTEIRVSIEGGQDERLVATIEVESDHQGASPGRRTLETVDPDCEDLSAAIIFVVTVAIDPRAAAEAELSSDSSSSDDHGVDSIPDRLQSQANETIHLAINRAVDRAHETSSASPPAHTATPAPQPQPVSSVEAESSWKLRAEAGGAIDLASAPSIMISPSAGIKMARAQTYLVLRARFEIPRIGEFPQGSARTSRRLGEFAGCRSSNRLFGCAVMIGGVYRASGVDLTDNRRGTHFYAATRLDIGVSISRLHLALGMEIPLIRPVLLVNSQPAWQVPPAFLHTGLSADFDFF